MVNPNVNTKLLSENGFAIGSILAGVSLGYAFDEAEIQQISILRSKAWQQIGFFKDVKNPKEMFDEFDRYSRHMIARVNGKIVASARLVFNNGHIDRCEHHKYQVTIPAWLWQEGFVETSRLVTDPDYRGGDLFLLMTQMIGKTVIQSGYRYMVSSCTQSLEKIYISSGCKKIGSFYTEDCKEPWTLLVMDVVSTSKGFGMNPIFWNLVQRPMVEYLEKRRYFALNWLEKCFMSFYKLFGPFADLVIQFKLNRKSEKKEQSEKAA
jgi:predicted GNAT family N-acyltransferase